MFVFASYNKGLILLRNDEKDQASKIFMRILKYDPLFELAYLRMGEELILAKDYVAANDILRKGLINLPESKEIQTLYNSTKSKI